MKALPGLPAALPRPQSGWRELVAGDGRAEVPEGFNWRLGALNIVLLSVLTTALATVVGVWMEHGLLVVALVLAVTYSVVLGSRWVALLASLFVLAAVTGLQAASPWLASFQDAHSALVAVNILSVLVVLLLAVAVEQRRQAAAGSRAEAERLRRQARLVRTFVDGLGPSIFVALLDARGAIVDVKHGAFGSSDAPARAWQGRCFADIEWWADGEARSAMEAGLAQAAGGNAARFDVCAQLDGEAVWLDCSLSPLTDHCGAIQHIVASAVSVDDRKRAQERLNTVVESAPTALIMVDQTGQIRFANGPAETLFGYPREDLVGSPLERLIPDTVRAGHARMMQMYFRNPQQRLMGAGRELYGLHADGHEFPLEIGLSPIVSGKEKIVMAAITDISERKAAHEALQAQADELEKRVRERTVQLEASNERWKQRNAALLQVNELVGLLTASRDEAEFCRLVAAYQPRLFPASRGALYLSEPDGLHRAAVWGEGAPPEESLVRDACWALRRGHVHYCGDGRAEPVCPHLEGALKAGEMTICLPLQAEGEGLGLLHLVLPAAGHDSETVLDEAGMLLRAVGGHFALALSNMRLHEALRGQAIHDALTGLYNRRYFETAGARVLAQARRAQRGCALVISDIDHFKAVNDTHGHTVGDEVLRRVATAMSSELRSEDIACRLGGEEFVALLPDAGREQAVACAQRIRAAVERLAASQGIAVTVSLGVALYPNHGSDLDDLLTAADEALYRAKDTGRNRVCLAERVRETVAAIS